MKIRTTSRFDGDYDDLPEPIKEQTDKQLSLFLDNPHHPSLRVKKIKGSPNIWEGRITKNYRFTFQIAGEIHILRRIGTHKILKTP
jgi:mRNA-degrading endonuclease RelE of RelBE toxin-antitoxin system